MGSIKILLADDSITIQKVVGIIFGGDDYSLTIVNNGAAAIEKAREIQPDIMLIDVLMPGMSGYEVCEAVRKEPALAGAPILLLTGSFEPFDEEKARQCGADDHIVKPFESQQIVAKVQELIAAAASRPEPAAPAVMPEPAFAPEPAFELESAFTPEPVPSFTEPTPQVSEPSPFEATIQQTPAVTPDDPWGAFTTQPAEPGPAAAAPVVESPFETGFSDTVVMPDVMELLQDEPVQPAVDANIGASWTPTEEQTFEFREEVAEAPPVALGNPFELENQLPEPAPVFDPAAFEPTAPVEPVVETVAEVPPQAVSPAVSAAVPALSEEQLKAAIMAASKETIERIVWEVVPDLAETMIKEAIRKITEGK